MLSSNLLGMFGGFLSLPSQERRISPQPMGRQRLSETPLRIAYHLVLSALATQSPPVRFRELFLHLNGLRTLFPYVGFCSPCFSFSSFSGFLWCFLGFFLNGFLSFFFFVFLRFFSWFSLVSLSLASLGCTLPPLYNLVGLTWFNNCRRNFADPVP